VLDTCGQDDSLFDWYRLVDGQVVEALSHRQGTGVLQGTSC